MDKHREAVERTYSDRCSIFEYQSYKKENHSIGYKEAAVYKKRPCRISFSTIASTSPTDAAAAMMQKVKLFIAPDIAVKPGSKIDVTRNGVTTSYSSSGMPAIYGSHQEIMLELFKGWA